MNDFPTSDNFRKHTENLTAVTAAITQIERAHKRAIRERDAPGESAMRKVHTLFLGVYAEARLRKIIDDPTGFDEDQRKAIWLKKSQLDRWKTAVEIAAMRHYGGKQGERLADVVPSETLPRFQEVLSLLNGDLEPVITDRNKLAHGQWVWQLKSQSDDQFTRIQASYDYNYVELRSRYAILDVTGQLVGILCVSEPTFNRDFDRLMSKIDSRRTELHGAGYKELVEQLTRFRSAQYSKST